MSITHLLDTSVYSQPLKKKPLPHVIHRWEQLGDNSCCISIFCEAELLQGLEMKNSQNLWQAYRAILENRLPIISFELKSAKSFAVLQATNIKQGKPKPVMDMIIAATAMAHNLILATCNYKDFKDIPGLQVEDWIQEI